MKCSSTWWAWIKLAWSLSNWDQTRSEQLWSNLTKQRKIRSNRDELCFWQTQFELFAWGHGVMLLLIMTRLTCCWSVLWHRHKVFWTDGMGGADHGSVRHNKADGRSDAGQDSCYMLMHCSFKKICFMTPWVDAVSIVVFACMCQQQRTVMICNSTPNVLQHLKKTEHLFYFKISKSILRSNN